MLRAILAIGVFALISGCNTIAPTIGSYRGAGEMYVGSGYQNMALGTAQFDVRGRNSGRLCSGTSQVTEPTAACSRRGGFAEFTCSDGRSAQAEWKATSCSAGYGFGADDRGEGFRFAFGMPETEAIRILQEGQTTTASRDRRREDRTSSTWQHRDFRTGTGFLIAEDGLIVTNWHVVEWADEVHVVVGDRLRKASLFAKNLEHDLVILKTDIGGTPIPVGRSDQVSVADEVMTLGYPLVQRQGQALKATFGRVNALSGAGDIDRLIQIDVPIQPGNSGGPLFNLKGEVIGVVTASLSDIDALATTGAIPQNVNYAVKSNQLTSLMRFMKRPPRATKNITFKEIVDRYKDSVFLVVAFLP